MKRTLFLTVLSLTLFAFIIPTSKGEIVAFDIPDEIKSDKVFTPITSNEFQVNSEFVERADFKGVVTIISDAEGKIAKIEAPENLPQDLYPQEFLKIKNLETSSEAYPCIVCWSLPISLAYACYLTCGDNDIDRPDDGDDEEIRELEREEELQEIEEIKRAN